MTQEEIAARREEDVVSVVERMFSREELFRFAYVPFVIAELVWDYADTVIIMARFLGDPATKKLSRAIRNARQEYDSHRRRVIDREHRDRELDNGYLFEEFIKKITDQMLLNIRIDIDAEYPFLGEASRNLLVAVYQCLILSRALLRFMDKQRREASKRIGVPVGDILPRPYYVMDRIIPEYIGDKPPSERFKALMEQYIETLAVQIALVGLNEVSDNQTNQS